jgi:molybdopterin/thiamine biosynthesis adenylyltransferase
MRGNKKRLIKLPGGRVAPFRPDPMAKLLTVNFADVPIPHPRVPESEPASGKRETSSDSTNPNRPHIDLSVLEGTRLLILGAGAVGSYLAYLLASIASLIIYVVDFDIVGYRNVRSGRTIFEAGQVGKRKVRALKEKIERDYPLTRVEPLPYDVLELPDIFLRQLGKKVSVVINAIDSGQGMLRINDLFYQIVEVLYVAAHQGALSGHVVMTAPFVTACLRCCLDINSASDIETLHAEPALCVDVRNIAHYCATLAVEVMYAKATGRPIQRWDISKNIFYIANQREQHSPDGPGVHLQQGHKRQGCPTCSVAPANVTFS